MPREAILVIDDEKDLLKLLRYNLEKEGYRVLSAETGEKGFEAAKAERPDAIILDLMLPQIDGLEVCRLLKVTKETQRIPVLMLTAKSSDVDQVVGLEVGASDYVTKHFSIKILLVRLKNILKRQVERAENPARTIKCCELTLDKDRHCVDVAGKRSNLSKTEFGILSVLMEHPNSVVSREELISAVWGGGAFVSGPAMNMQIKCLREKLGRYRDYIETVRGTGFRFC